MLQLLKYRFKCKLRHKILIFWNMLFPIFLATIFGVVLIQASSTPVFETIPIAIVNNARYQNDNVLKEIVNRASVKEKKMFQVQVVTEQEAKTLLEHKDIRAYVVFGEPIQVHVFDNGMSATMTKLFFDDYVRQIKLMNNMLKDGKSQAQIQAVMEHTNMYVNEKTKDNSDLSASYFYALLAMQSFIGGHWAIESMYELQANQSSRGLRIAAAPTPKIVHMLVDLVLNIGLQIVFIAIVCIYMNAVFQVSFGSNFPYVFLLLIIAAIAANGLGSVIGNLAANVSVTQKSNILTIFTLSASFLSGMMSMNIKLLVDTFVPLLGHMNPINMVTDGLYALYHYGVGDRYLQNISYLLIFTFLCYGISFLCIRKKTYATLEVD